jgi:hypothetical protein
MTHAPFSIADPRKQIPFRNMSNCFIFTQHNLPKECYTAFFRNDSQNETNKLAPCNTGYFPSV